MNERTYTAVFERDPESGWYAARIEEVPGAISQGETLEEARANLREALVLVLEVQREMDAERQIIREPFRLESA